MDPQTQTDDPDLIEVLRLIGAMEAPLQAFLYYLRREHRWPAPVTSPGRPMERRHPS